MGGEQEDTQSREYICSQVKQLELQPCPRILSRCSRLVFSYLLIQPNKIIMVADKFDGKTGPVPVVGITADDPSELSRLPNIRIIH